MASGYKVIDDLEKQTNRSIRWNVSVKAPYEVFRFGISIIVARILDPRDFGIVSIATMLIYYANTLTNLGFNQALVQRYEINNGHVNSVFTLDLSVSIFMAGLFYAFAPLMASFFRSPESISVIRAMSLSFIVSTFYDLPHCLLRRNLHFQITSIVDATREVLVSIITVFLAISGFRYWSIVWGHLIPILFCAMYLCFKARWLPTFQYHHSRIQELFTFGIWSFVRAQVYFLTNRIDRFIIARFSDLATLGLYDKAKSLSQMPYESITAQLNSVLFSSTSRSQYEVDSIANLLYKSLTIVSLLTFPIYFGLCSVAEHFVLVMLGKKWSMIIIPLQIMSLSGIFLSTSGVMGTVLTGGGFHKQYSILQIIGTVFLFCLSLFMVPFGIEAVSVGFLIYAVISFIMNFVLLKRMIHFGLKDFIVAVFPALAASVLMFSCVKLIHLVLVEKFTMLNLSLMVIIGVSTYFAELFFLNVKYTYNLKTLIPLDIYSLFEKFNTKRNIVRNFLLGMFFKKHDPENR